MKLKVSEATRIQIDWLVAKCEGKLERITQAKNWGELCKQRGGVVFTHSQLYSPTTDPAQGQPILEREKIGTAPTNAFNLRDGHDVWTATLQRPLVQFGPTMLTAGLRCFVASKLGDEVEVPDELCP